MTALQLALVAALAPAWEPSPTPPPTPWALAGARGWTVCDDLARLAMNLPDSGLGRMTGTADSAQAWAERADRCPNVPEVLVLAALLTLVDAGRLPAVHEVGERVDTVVAEHARSLDRALRWIDAALAESDRRMQLPPPETLFFRAYILLSRGRYEQADRALAKAVAVGDVERWRSDRLGALVALFSGDLERALRLAQRSVVDAPPEDRRYSRYVRAMVLDRAGASAAARAELAELRREPGYLDARVTTETLMPIHERLYLRALDSQAAEEASSALRLWEAYLARPEPERPERELAERHRAELSPPPAPVGGPVK